MPCYLQLDNHHHALPTAMRPPIARAAKGTAAVAQYPNFAAHATASLMREQHP